MLKHLKVFARVALIVGAITTVYGLSKLIAVFTVTFLIVWALVYGGTRYD